MEKIKILHVIGGMNRCGAETFIMNVYREINKEKYIFYFLCYENEKKYEYEDEIEKLGGKIIKIPQLKKIGIIKFKNLIKEIIQKNKFDVIHAHTYFNSAIPLLVAKKEGIKIRIIHSHNTKSEFKSPLIKKIYNRVSKIIINKNANYFLACSDEAAKSLFFREKKFEIVKNGICLEDFVFNKKNRDLIRKKLNIKNNEIVIGHIGRFEEQKNHIFLINVFEKVLLKNRNYKLLLLGDGSKIEEIKKMCRDKKIIDSVIFMGNIPNVNEVINCFDVFVFPSLFEGLGIVLIEAQVNGLKCLVSTEVPKEADISNNVKFLKLDDGIEKWTNQIYNCDCNRNDFDINKCNYNIKYTVKQLENIYDLKE